MTSVALSKLWLTDAADPTSAVVLPIRSGSTEAWPNPMEVREYAGGRYRLVTRAGLSRSWVPALGMVSVAQARELQRRAGDLHWARDPWGGRVACGWSDPRVTWLGYVPSARQDMATVALLLTEVSHLEVED